MTAKPLSNLKLPLWQRVAAFFSFLALASALLAPSALLAKEVRTGKLGGLCAAGSVAAGAQSGGLGDVDVDVDVDVDAPQSHCDACASTSAVLFYGVMQPVANPLAQNTRTADRQLKVFAHGGQPACIRGPPER